MKVVVVKLGCPDEKIKQKAMQSVSGLSGVVSIAVDTKDQKLTVIGDIDPVAVMGKLRKLCHSEIVTVGPVKEPEKKKEEPKKEEPAKKVEPKKEDDPKKKEEQAQLLKAYQARQQAYYQNAYYQAYQQPPAMATPAYFNRSVEEDPNGCVIS